MIEVAVIVGLLLWVGGFAGWWLHQMIRMDREDYIKPPRGWRVVNGRIRPRDHFNQWFKDYPYDHFGAPDDEPPQHH